MRFETGIKDARNFWVRFQKLRERHCVSVVTLDSQLKRAKPAQQKPAIERTQHLTRNDCEIPRALHEFLGTYKHASSHVVMTAKIFRSAMNYSVESKLKRSLIN